jgi:hypothetical protein
MSKEHFIVSSHRDDEPTRYERILLRGGAGAARYAAASAAARRATPVYSDRERNIRDVAAGVAAPTLIGYAHWVLAQATQLRLKRLRFLSRDGQVLYEIARRLAASVRLDIDLEYVYSSRMTWNLAGSEANHLADEPWLYRSFMKSNATDLCTRLGLPIADFAATLRRAGVNLDPDVRADDPAQLAALRRFVGQPEVSAAMSPRIARIRDLVRDYAQQHDLASSETGLVDSGWTGRMVEALGRVLDAAALPRPYVFMWGYEPRRDGWSVPAKLHAFMYETARAGGLRWRIPNAPFLVETFCMADHGVVTGLRREPSGLISACLQSHDNPAAKEWGATLYRTTLMAACEALDSINGGGVQPFVYDVMRTFWLKPSKTEAITWGAYPYDSDPAMTAVRPLARPITINEIGPEIFRRRLNRGDRAWLWGSLALSSPAVRLVQAVIRDPGEYLADLGVVLAQASNVTDG